MASVLRQLGDGDLDVIHHMIRRDAVTDVVIADAAGERLGRVVSATEAGRVNVIHRYRKSRTYRAWLKRWRDERSGMEKALAGQRSRFQMLDSILSEGEGTGLDKTSKYLQARALTLAAEAPEDEFLEGLQGKGWVANALKLAQATVRDQYRKKAVELKKQIEEMANKSESGAAAGVSMADVVSKVDDIMGL